METQPSTKSFDAERSRTDQSLGAEREKTTSSIVHAQVIAEERTDQIIKQKRTQTDEATSNARVEADSLPTPLKTEEEIQSEREAADRAVAGERSNMDEALGKERQAKKTIAVKLLARERKETDRNLSMERSEADSEVVRTSGRLTEEMAEHVKTKFALTTREEFLAIVSHDLKNPIGAAASCAQMLLEDFAYSETNAENIRPWIEFIKRNLDTSLRLIADLLDMERIAHDKLQLRLGKYSVEGLIKESVDNFAASASVKTVLLRTSLPKDLGELVCDHDRMLQVISNLVGNAIKFTPEGGTVTLGAEVVDGEIQFYVRDTGPGIPEDKQAKLFERFTQLASSDRGGLGLGLYISRMIVKAHHGKIWLHSKPNEGSTFFFSIPCGAEAH